MISLYKNWFNIRGFRGFVSNLFTKPFSWCKQLLWGLGVRIPGWLTLIRGAVLSKKLISFIWSKVESNLLFWSCLGVIRLIVHIKGVPGTLELVKDLMSMIRNLLFLKEIELPRVPQSPGGIRVNRVDINHPDFKLVELYKKVFKRDPLEASSSLLSSIRRIEPNLEVPSIKRGDIVATLHALAENISRTIPKDTPYRTSIYNQVMEIKLTPSTELAAIALIAYLRQIK